MRVRSKKLAAKTGLLALAANCLIFPSQLAVEAQTTGSSHARPGSAAPAPPQPDLPSQLGLRSALHGTVLSSNYLQLTPNTAQLLQNLVIPKGLSAVIDFGSLPNLILPGQLINYGHLYAVSTNPAVNLANITANNIVNAHGALLTTTLPANGIAGLTNLNSALNLSLNSANNIVNQGTISSAGQLNLHAIGAIINALPTGVTGPAPVIQSASNLNLISDSGNLVNSGIINAVNGNINIAAAASNNIAINNTNGVMQALSGIINVRDASFAAKSNLNVIGGNILAKELNFNSGCGIVDVLADDIRGIVNVTGGETHVSAATPNLILGNVTVSGDPAFYNTATNGDITIAGSLQFSGQDLAIVSSRNIITAPGASLIDTSSSTGRGGDITLIAGANFTASSSSGPAAPGQVLPNTPDAHDANINLTITGASSSGGRIDLTGGGSANITQFSSSSTAGHGGNVTIAAFSGADANSGSIKMPAAVPITTGGAGASSANGNGNVLIIAGLQSGAAVDLGTINTSNTAGAASATQTGSVNVVLSQPTLYNGTSMIIRGGTVKSGALIGSNTAPTGTVSAGGLSIQTEEGFSISSPGALSIGNLSVTGAGGVVAAGKDLTTTGAVNIASADSATSIGKTVQFVAGAQVTYSCGFCASTTPGVSLTINPSSLNGGNIDMSASSNVLVNTSGIAGNAGAGDIYLIAFQNASTGGKILLPTTSNLKAQASGSGLYGNVNIIGASDISVGAISGNRVNVYSAQPASSASDSIIFDYRGKTITSTTSSTAAKLDSFIAGTKKSGNITINDDIEASTQFNLTTAGNLSGGLGKFISADAQETNIAGNIYISAASVNIQGGLKANGIGPGDGGNLTVIATSGDLSVGNLNSSGNRSGSISLLAPAGAVNVGPITSLGLYSGNVTIIARKDVVVGNIDASANLGNAGYVLISTGNSQQSANITAGSIITQGVTSGGLVMLVNSSKDSATTNLSVGDINTDAIGFNGQAGPVSLVSRGGIALTNISAKATADGASTSAKGGSIFISSGGTGASSISISGASIDTSATNNGVNDIAGNIILLTAAASTGVNPANINLGSSVLTANGGTSHTAFLWGLNGASSTIPSNLNVTPSASINIAPGGYQTVQGSSSAYLNFSLDTGSDSQLVVPLNTGAGDSQTASQSMFLGTITQASGKDNIVLLSSGPIISNKNQSTAKGTSYWFLVSPAGFENSAAANGQFNIDAGAITLAAVGSSKIDNSQLINLTASKSILLLGDLFPNNGSFNSNTNLNAGATILFQNIGQNCCNNVTATVSLTAGGSIAGQNLVLGDGTNTIINSGSSISIGNINASSTNSGGSGVRLISTGYVSVGDIKTGSFTQESGPVSITSGSNIITGNIYTDGTGGGAINLSANGPISTLNLNANTSGSFGGTIVLNSKTASIRSSSISSGNFWGGQTILRSAGYIEVGDISTIGGHGNSGNQGSGGVTIASGGSITVGNVYTFSDGCCNDHGSADLTLTSNGSVRYQNIKTGSTDSMFGGNVFITAASSIDGFNIVSSDGAGGKVNLVAGNQISVGLINTSHISNCAGNCGGGDVIAVALGGKITVNGAITAFSTQGPGGNISLTAKAAISTGNISTYSNNNPAGNIYVSSGSTGTGAVALGILDTSSSSTAANAAGSIFLGANSAGTNGQSASGNSQISFTRANNYSQSVTPSPFLFYDGAPSSITTNSTISIKSSSVTIHPGVYSADIGSSGTPVSLTLDLGGDARTLVPLVSQGNIYLSGLSANNDNSLTNQKNGYTTVLISKGSTGVSLTGDVTALHAASGTDGLIAVYSLGSNGTISQTSGKTFTGSTLNLYALQPSTDIGSAGQAIAATVSQLSVIVGNNSNIYINPTGSSVKIASITTGGNAKISASADLTIDVIYTPGSLDLQAAGKITSNNTERISSANLNVSANGDITLFTNSDYITANSSTGNLTIKNSGTALSLGSIAAAGLTIKNSGSIDLNGTISGTNVSLQPALGLTIQNGSVISPTLSFSVNSFHDIDIPSGVLVLTPGSNAGNGATVSLVSRGNLRVNGDINTTPYGQITISTGSSLPFIIGGNTTLNGINGKLIANGTGASTTGGLVSITSSTSSGITLTDPSYIVLSTPGVVLSAGGQLTLNANNGPLNIQLISGTAGTISVDGAAGGTGGSIHFAGNPFTTPATANILLSNNGTNVGTSPGIIDINNTSNSVPLTIGNGLGQVSISSTGVSKTFQIQSTSNLTIDMSAITYDKPGVRTTVSFTSFTNLKVLGDIDVSGSSSSNAVPSVTLYSASNSLFSIGPTYSGNNGVIGKVIANGIGDAGGSINIFGSNGVNILDPSYLSVTASSSPASRGGQLTIATNSSQPLNFTFDAGNKNLQGVPTGTLSVDSQGNNSTKAGVSPSITLTGVINVTGGNLILSANGGTGVAGGKIVLNSYGSLLKFGIGTGEIQAIANFASSGGTAGQITVFPSNGSVTVAGSSLSASAPAGFAGTQGTGGSILIQSFSSTNSLTLSSGTITAAGGGSQGVGGTVTIQMPSIGVSSNSLISVAGGSKAGQISITLSDATKELKIGTAGDAFKLSAAGGGGTIQIDTPGNITIAGPSNVIDAVDSNLYMYFKHLDYQNGIIDVGSGTLQLSFNANQDINIGGSTYSSTSFDFTVDAMSRTYAGQLYIGNPFFTVFGNVSGGNNPFAQLANIAPYPFSKSNYTLGNITVLSDTNLSKYGTAVINSVGNFTATGKTLIAGSTLLQIVGSGDFHTGTITGDDRSRIDVVQWNRNGSPNFVYDVNGPITVRGGGQVGIYTGAGAITTINANVGGGAFTTLGIGLDASFKQTTGVISGTNLTLVAQTSIGSRPPNTVLYSNDGIVNINTRNLTVDAYGDIYINNLGTSRLTVQQSEIGGAFYLASSAPIITVGQVRATTVALATSAGSDAGITLASAIIGTLPLSRSNDTNYSVSLSADGSGRIVQQQFNQITAPTLLLQTGGGDIGSATKFISTSSTGQITINIATGLRGSAYVANNQAVTLLNSQAGGNFYFKNDHNLTVNNLATGNGSITLETASGGDIIVNSDRVLNAVGGNLTLHVPSDRNIIVNSNASLNAASTLPSLGDVFLAAGNVQKVTGASAPGNTSVSTVNGGVVYWGTKGITTSAPNNIITADTNDVAFFTTNSTSQISLGGGVQISARPVSHYLNSLDLTDPKNVAQIQTLIADGVITGSLQVSGGIATGGSITIPQYALIYGLGLYALKIPANVTVSFNGTWTASTPINVNLGVCSGCTQVVQKGNLVFPNGSDVVINLGMPNQNGKNNFMDSNKISATTKTIYVKMDNDEFYAAPITSGSNPYFDDCPNGKTPLPAPATQAKPSGALTPARCSGGGGDASAAGVSSGAAGANAGGGGDGSSGPTPDPKLSINPKTPGAAGTKFLRCLTKEQRDKNCDDFGNSDVLKDGNGEPILNSKGQKQPTPEALLHFPRQSSDPELNQTMNQLKADSYANNINNCHGTTNYIATGGQSQASRWNGITILRKIEKDIAESSAKGKQVGERNQILGGLFSPKLDLPKGMYSPEAQFDPCTSQTGFNPGDVIIVKDAKTGEIIHSATVWNVDSHGNPQDVVQTSAEGTRDLNSQDWSGFLEHNGPGNVDENGHSRSVQLTVQHKL